MTTQLVICDTCAALGDQPAGADWAEKLRAQVAAAGVDVDIVTTSCMNMCQSPVSLAVQAPGKATYLFADTDPERDSKDIVELLRLYKVAKDGWITDARTLGRLRQCLRGRVPAL